MIHNDEDATDDLRRWLGDDHTPVAGPDRTADGPTGHGNAGRAALVALALLPWALLGVAALARSDDPRPTTARASTAPAVDDSGAHPSTRTEGARRPPASAAGTVGAGASRAASDGVSQPSAAPAAAAPTAVRLVRDALTRSGARSTAVDVAAAEAPMVEAPGVWVVRVHTVVLRGDRRRWRTAAHETWAVPVALRDGRVVGLDRPWRVATDGDSIASVSWRRAEVDRAAVRAALDDAGMPSAPGLRVQQHPRLDAVVRVTTGGQHVWVRTAPEVGVIGHVPAERTR